MKGIRILATVATNRRTTCRTVSTILINFRARALALVPSRESKDTNCWKCWCCWCSIRDIWKRISKYSFLILTVHWSKYWLVYIQDALSKSGQIRNFPQTFYIAYTKRFREKVFYITLFLKTITNIFIQYIPHLLQRLPEFLVWSMF